MFRSLFASLFIIVTFVTNTVWAAVAGKIILVKGDVSATDNKGEKRSLKRRSEIEEGDTITTGPNAQVQIKFNDNAVLALRPGSQLVIREYHFADSDNPNEKVLMDLLTGGFRTITGSIGKSSSDAYQIRTPEASIGIRGTNFELVNMDGRTLAAVWNGGISITNDEGSLDLGLDSDFSFAVVTEKSPPKGLLTPPEVLTQPLTRREEESTEEEEQETEEDSDSNQEEANEKKESTEESTEDESSNTDEQEASDQSSDEENTTTESEPETESQQAENTEADSSSEPSESNGNGSVTNSESRNVAAQQPSSLPEQNNPQGSALSSDFSSSSLGDLDVLEDTAGSGSFGEIGADIQALADQIFSEEVIVEVETPAEALGDEFNDVEPGETDTDTDSNTDTATDTLTDTQTDTVTDTDTFVEPEIIDDRITNLMVEQLLDNPETGFIVLTGQDADHNPPLKAVTTADDTANVLGANFTNQAQADFYLRIPSGATDINFTMDETLVIYPNGNTSAGVNIEISAGGYTIAELHDAIAGQIPASAGLGISLEPQPFVSAGFQIRIHNEAEGVSTFINASAITPSGTAFFNLNPSGYYDSISSAAANNNLEFTVSYIQRNDAGVETVTDHTIVLDKPANTPQDLAEMINDQLLATGEHSQFFATVTPDGKLSFISTFVEEGSSIEVSGLNLVDSSTATLTTTSAAFFLGFVDSNSDGTLFAVNEAREGDGDNVHYGFLVKDENGVPYFANFDEETLDSGVLVVDGNFNKPDVIFRGSIETWQSANTTSAGDLSAFTGGEQSVIIENIAGLDVTWGYWFNDPTNPAFVDQLEDSDERDEDFPRAFFFVDVDPALPSQLTGIATFGSSSGDVPAQIGLGHDGVVSSLSANFTVDFSTGEILSGQMNIITPNSDWAVHQMQGNVDGAQAFIDKVDARVQDLSTMEVFDATGNLGGVFTNSGDSFAGGYNLESTGSTGRYVDGVFIINKQ